MIRWMKRTFPFLSRAYLDSILTYPRFLGTIKPRLLAAAEQESLSYLSLLHRSWTPSLLEVPVGRRLLALTAHPDDETIGAGGLLLAHRGKCELHLVNLFSGDTGGRLPEKAWTDTPEYRAALALKRRREYEETGRRLGAASVQSMDLPSRPELPDERTAQELRKIVAAIRPDVVLLPWYLDNQRDHRLANILYAWGCADLDCRVLGFEIWTPCHPNAAADISGWIDEKAELVRSYGTQSATIDYAGYVRGLAAARAFWLGFRPDRGGATEAFLALPNRDYCDLVRSLYGGPYQLNPAVRPLLR